MEHLLVPRRPYTTMKGPFLGQKYMPPDVNTCYEDYLRKQGWDLLPDEATIDNYEFLDQIYHVTVREIGDWAAELKGTLKLN